MSKLLFVASLAFCAQAGTVPAEMEQVYIDAKDVRTVREVYPCQGMPAAAKMIPCGEAANGFLGFGTALTGSSCWMLSKMPKAERTEFLKKLYSKDGDNLSVARLTIGASDYSVELYSYDDVPFDTELKHFSIAKDEEYVIPMIKEILSVRSDITFFASPWSPPGWMKTGGSMCGGYMRDEFVDCYADYVVKFILAYAKHGIKISAITPQNEPVVHQGGRMPACIWHPEVEAHYVQALRKKLTAAGLKTEIWLYDHNFAGVDRVRWTLNSNKSVRDSVNAVAFHYYEGVVEQTASLTKEFPGLKLHFTEGGPRLYDNYTTDWCKWSVMISRAIACGYKSFCGWNLLLDERGGPSIAPFMCGGLFTRHSVTGEMTASGQGKVYSLIAPEISPDDELCGLREEFAEAQVMFAYPNRRESVVGFMIRKPGGEERVVLVNPWKEKAQVNFKANGKIWYTELQPNSVSVIRKKK